MRSPITAKVGKIRFEEAAKDLLNDTTGWRTPSEILPLEWRQVDMKAGEVRLDAGTTKNGDGRVFQFTTASCGASSKINTKLRRC